MNGIITTLLLMGLVGQAQATDAPQQIRQALRTTKITHIQPTPIDGLYEVTAGNNIFYSDKKGNYLVFGHLYDVKTQTDLTAKAQAALQKTSKVAWKQLPKATAIISGTKGGAKVAVFTDVDCPYCQRLHHWLTELKGIEVYESLYPIAELHPDALATSEHILCSSKPFKSLEQAFSKQLKPTNKPCKTPALTRIQQFAKQQGFEGTPILIREDGAVMKGLPSNKTALANWLKGK